MPVELNVFLQNDKGAADGKAVTINKSGGGWADQMDFGMSGTDFMACLVKH